MRMNEERQQIVAFGKKIASNNLTPGTSGNLSIYNSKEKLIAISPSGIDYYDTLEEDIVIIDLDGNIIEGSKKPSSEWRFHVAFYKRKPHIRAVVHTHSLYSTILSTLGMGIKAVHYGVGDSNAAEVPCAPYELYGTWSLAEEAVETAGESDAVILSNHGIITCGKNISSAYNLLCNLEYVAEVQCKAMMIGTPNILTNEEMKKVLEKFKSYGQVDEK